jgi:multiple sugar transport system ATP-binding protein
MASLSLQHINKTYPNGFEAVKDFNLEIEDKEFIIFVGQDAESLRHCVW